MSKTAQIGIVTKKEYESKKGKFYLTAENVYEGIILKQTATQITILAERKDGETTWKHQITGKDYKIEDVPSLKELDKLRAKRKKDDEIRTAQYKKEREKADKIRQKETAAKLIPFATKTKPSEGDKIWAAVKDKKVIDYIYMDYYGEDSFLEHREKSREYLSKRGELMSGSVYNKKFLPK